MIVEHQDDAQKFRDGYNFDKQKQKSIASQFFEMINRQPAHGYDVDGLFVVFSAFALTGAVMGDTPRSTEAVGDKTVSRSVHSPVTLFAARSNTTKADSTTGLILWLGVPAD